MTVKIERVSAITLKVADLERSVGFYRDTLGTDLIYGGPDAYFSSLRIADAEFPVLNLEQGAPVIRWGRIILHVADVDASWAFLKERGFAPERPQNASWGERYFHMNDPDGHELSFARPL